MARFVTIGGRREELPRGVEVRDGSVRISFTYRGRRYYETLYREATVETVCKAGVKRAAILLEIEGGIFDYRRHFPDSKRALQAEGFVNASPRATVGEMLEEEQRLAAERKAPSTVTSERPRHKHILAFFGAGQLVKHITAEDVERFKRQLRRRYSAKTVNNTLVALRAILKRAYHRGILERPMHDRFENLPAEETRPQREVHPLTLAELAAIEQVQGRDAVRMAVLFNCWTGLSLSELMALAWEDVDTRATPWRVTVRRARVDWDWKVPKERSRHRVLELNSKAQAHLSSQRPRTQLLESIGVETLQRDNLTRTPESIRPVFRRASGLVWDRWSFGEAFAALCRDADIEARGPNQMRHTFASRMLTAGVPPHILARLLGHTGDQMIRRHYGRWIDDDTQGQLAAVMNAAISRLNR